MLCYVVAYLDRVNVGFAKLQMTSDLGLSDAVYGFGAGIFFFGYFIFEIPSNVILQRSARACGSRGSWCRGASSPMLTMFVTTPTMFYVMRFLLGAGRGGLLPRHHPLSHLLVSGAPARAHDDLFMTAIALSG